MSKGSVARRTCGQGIDRWSRGMMLCLRHAIVGWGPLTYGPEVGVVHPLVNTRLFCRLLTTHVPTCSAHISTNLRLFNVQFLLLTGFHLYETMLQKESKHVNCKAGFLVFLFSASWKIQQCQMSTMSNVNNVKCQECQMSNFKNVKCQECQMSGM